MPGRSPEGDSNDQGLLDPESNVEAEEPQSLCSRFQVAIVFVVFVTLRAFDRVFLKNLQNELATSTYNSVWSNIFWPLAVQILITIVIGGYVLLQRWQGNPEYNCRFFLPSNPLASTKGAIPMLQLALFQLGDQLNAALSAPASPFVSQAIQSVLTNFTVIFMAIIAFFWIKTRFKQVHFVGMALVVMAAVVQVAPQITSNDCSPEALKQKTVFCISAYHSPEGGPDGKWIKMSVGQMTFFLILFVVSTAPQAVSNVYKQKVLQGCDADVFYVAFWAGWWQVVWGWACVPLSWIPLPGQDVLTPGETFSAIGRTLQCIMGSNPTFADTTCDAAPPPWIWIVLYLGCNITFNVALTWLTKRMSAAWAQVATVLCLNVTDIVSAWRAVMGANAQPLSLYDWLGAIIVSIALWVYNVEPEIIADAREVNQVTGNPVAESGSSNKVAAHS